MPGSFVNTGSPTSLAMMHADPSTASNMALFAAVAVAPLSGGQSYTGFTRTLKFNGASMTSLGAVDCSASQSGWVEFFCLLNPASVNGNLVFTVSSSVSSILMESASISNVSQITPGSAVAVANTGTSSNVTVASAPNKLVIGAFACSGPILSQQVVSVVGATGGTFPLSFNGSAPATIAYNASATAMETALWGLSTIGAGNVTVTGSNPWTVTFNGVLAGAAQNLLATSSANLTGGTASVAGLGGGLQMVLQNVSNTESGNLLLVDAPGAASVVLPAATSLSNDWGAVVCSVDTIHTAQSDHQAAVDGVVSGISGPSSGNSASTLRTAVAGQQQTVATTSQNVGGLAGLNVATLNAALQKSAAGSGGGGLYETVNFSSYSNQSNLANIPTSGSAFTTGTATLTSLNFISGSHFETPFGGGAPSAGIGITSGTAVWQSSITTGFDAEYFPTATSTDYQIVSMTMSALNSLGNIADSNMLIGRSNTTMGTCVIAVLFNGFVALGCYVSGSWTSFGGVSHTPIAGALYELVLGNNNASPNPLYGLQVLCNGTVLINYNDTSHVSQVGSSYRYAGPGMCHGGSSGLPASLSSWGVADNSPPATIGSGFRAYRTTTGNGTFPTGGTSGSWTIVKAPASWFDTIQWETGDLTWSSFTNTLTVSIAGWYIVSVSLQASTSASSNIGIGFYHNGSWANQISGLVTWPSGSNPPFQGTFFVYCAANDTLAPGFYYSAGASFAPTNSDSTGQNNYFQVCLANCGTLS